MNLLVVEDNADIVTLLSMWLADIADLKVRVDATTVSDDDIAWADVVLADYSLPTTNGCAVLARIEAQRPEVRRIMWTAVAEAHCDHAQFIVVKPVSLIELRAVIDA